MMILMALVPLEIFFVKMNSIQDKEDKIHDVFLKVHILTVHTLCYIGINGIFLTSFLIMNYLLSFIWKLIDHKFLSNKFAH